MTELQGEITSNFPEWVVDDIFQSSSRSLLDVLGQTLKTVGDWKDWQLLSNVTNCFTGEI